MEEFYKKMSPLKEALPSTPSLGEILPVEVNSQYRSLQPRRNRLREATDGGGGFFSRLADLLCIGYSRRRRRNQRREDFISLERTVTNLQRSNRILEAKTSSLIEETQVAAEQRQKDVATMQSMRQKLHRLSVDNDHVRKLGEETASKLQNKEQFLEHLQLFIKMQQREISDLEAAYVKSVKENQEQLKTIDDLTKELSELRSQTTKEVDQQTNEQSKQQQQLQEAPTQEQQDELLQGASPQQQQDQLPTVYPQQQQDVAGAVKADKKRTRRGGVKHRRHHPKQDPKQVLGGVGVKTMK